MIAIWLAIVSTLVAQANTNISDMDLKKIAEKELSASERMSPVIITGEKSVIVNTDAAIQESGFRYARSEFELGAQTYAPLGSSKLVGSETYSLGQLEKKPMFVFGARYWAFEWDKMNMRFGPSANLSITNHSLNVRTESGRQYKDVRGTTILSSVGADAEWMFYRRFALGLHLGLGKLFYIQSGASSQLSSSLDANFWEIGPMVRAYFYNNMYAKLNLQSRKVLSTEDNLGVQSSSLVFSVGMGM